MPLPYYQNSWAGVPADGWTTTPTGIAPPAWLLLNGDFAGGSAGDVVVHSTNGYDPLASVRWTAPTDGVIDITGQSWDVQHSEGRDDMWMLYVNNVLVATRESILGVVKDSADALFANNLAPSQSLTGLAINGGDDVRFIVQETTGNPGHFSGVQLTIAFTPVPTPAALPAGLALLSALAFRRR